LRPYQKRFPWAPLEAWLARCEQEGVPVTTRKMQAEWLGVPPRQISRWRHIGVDFWQADTLACRIGVVPYVIWPEWLEWSIVWEAQEAAVEMDQARIRCRECGKWMHKKRVDAAYCSFSCRSTRTRDRKVYRREYYERQGKAIRRAYYEANAEREKGYRRRRYALEKTPPTGNMGRQHKWPGGVEAPPATPVSTGDDMDRVPPSDAA
jgi:hypothetical protein